MRVHVLAVVDDGRLGLPALADAIRRHSPDASIGAVWNGDPHRRPACPAPGIAWDDLGLPTPSPGIGWGHLLVALPAAHHGWVRAAATARRLAGAHDDLRPERLLIVRVGDVCVDGPLDHLLADTMPVTVVHRTGIEPFPSDGLSPSEADVVAFGRCSDALAVVDLTDPDVAGRLDQLVELATTLADAPMGAVLDRWAERSATWLRGVPVAGWSAPDQVWPTGAIDTSWLHAREPWRFDIGGRPTRVRLSSEPDLARRLTDTAPQRTGAPVALRLPGAIEVDAEIRTLVAAAIADHRRTAAPLPPEPFGADHRWFVRWLETPSPSWGAAVGRYWRAVRERRADLQVAFPELDAGDLPRFVEWCERSWRLEDRTSLLRPRVAEPSGPTSVGVAAGGLNVIGYLDHDLSLGDVGRRVVDALRAANVPVAAVAHRRTGSPLATTPIAVDDAVRYGTNLVVVNADQFHFFAADHGRTVLDGRRTIAYWFWELEQVPEQMREAISFVDEIWAGSQFVVDAFAAVSDVPVTLVPIPVPEPTVSGRDRASFDLPADRVIVLVTFDHFSVMERKNPLGAIEAFRRAFPEPTPDGPVLVVKTMNGHIRWENHERLLLAAAGRPDIVVRDEHLDRADQMALLAASDILVSLHRSEGLGLHCAEAMWLGTPVIATNYSGNVDFMSDHDSVLIDARMVPVEHGEGVYPADAEWADPDLDLAAAEIRSLVTDPKRRQRLAGAARRRMAEQPSPSATGRRIARAAGLIPPVAERSTRTSTKRTR
jgi:glycosyltransferase involved in cell wall biosynthesis